MKREVETSCNKTRRFAWDHGATTIGDLNPSDFEHGANSWQFEGM